MLRTKQALHNFGCHSETIRFIVILKKNSNVNNPPETFACTLLADETLHSGVCKRQRTTDVSANARVHQAADHTA